MPGKELPDTESPADKKNNNKSKACLVILVLLSSAESLSQEKPFKCSGPNPARPTLRELSLPFLVVSGQPSVRLCPVRGQRGTVQDKSQATAATCPAGTGPPAGGVNVVPSPAGRSWLLPPRLGRPGLSH